jgi:hypothetical protein
VRKTLGKKQRQDNINSAKRAEIFGEWFAHDPSDFMFFPGEKSSIRLAVEMAKTMVAEYDLKRKGSPLLLESSNKRPRQVEEARTPIISATNTTSIPSSNTNVNNEQQQQPLLRKGKTVAQYFFNWVESTKYPIKYEPSQCNIDLVKASITCTACNLQNPFKVYEECGSWKLSTGLVSHLKLHHKSDAEGSIASNASGEAEESIGSNASGEASASITETPHFQ